jgi:ribonuclease D
MESLPLNIKAKYFDIKINSWREIEVKIDKKLNFDYSQCNWFAIDGEFTGLYPVRDRDVLWTIASEDTNGELRAEMIYTFDGDADLELFREIISSDKEKYFYFGQMDMAFLYKLLGVKVAQPVFDVKVVSKAIRSYTGEHYVDGLMKSLYGVTEELTQKKELGKSKEFGIHPSEWPIELHQYNINDVAYLRPLVLKLRKMAQRLDRVEVMNSINAALPELALIYASGYYRNIFDHGYNDTDIASGTIISRFGK